MINFEQINKYFTFTEKDVFQKLHKIFSNKLLIKMNYQEELSHLIRQVQTQARHVSHQKDTFFAIHPQIESYIDIFEQILYNLRDQHDSLWQQRSYITQDYLQQLSKCQKAQIQSQKQLLDYIRQQITKLQKQIGKVMTNIQKQFREIDYNKEQCFIRMLEFINCMNEEHITARYLRLENQSSFKFYGSRRSEMNQNIQIINFISETIIQEVNSLRKLEDKANLFLIKASKKNSQIQNQKIMVINELIKEINPKYVRKDPIIKILQIKHFQPIPVQNPFEYSKLSFIKKTIYLLMNPIPQNQILISHRQTFSQYVKKRQSISLICERQFIQTQRGGEVEDELYYEYIGFVNKLQQIVAKDVDHRDVDKFMEVFQQLQKKKGYRQLFLFYLFQGLKKTTSFTLKFNIKQSQIIIRMVDIFLTKCAELFDSQSSLKLLMISYHINLSLQLQSQLTSKLRQHSIWKVFQFWQTSFLQCVYEYFDVVVIFYHQMLEQKANTEQRNQQTNWFASIIKFKPFWVKEQTKKIEHKNPMQEFYRQIIKNLSLIFLCNMIVLFVPPTIIQKFQRYVLSAIQKLEWGSDYISQLQKIFEIVVNKGEANLKKLLRNDSVLERIMSKLLGTGTSIGKQASIPMSKVVADWLGEK